VQFITVFLTFHLGLDILKCLFLSSFQTEILCVFSISRSEFLFSYLLHFFSVLHPPPFNAQYKSCISSLCCFAQLPGNPLSLSPCCSKIFPCLIVGTKHKHIIEQFSVPETAFFQILPAMCNLCHLFEQVYTIYI